MVEPTRTSNAVAWIALIFSILSLFIGITAYKRSGQNLLSATSDQTRDVNNSDQAQKVVKIVQEQVETEENTETADQLAARVEAETALLEVRADIVANKITNETVVQLQEVRGNLKEAYADADMEIGEQYMELDNDLETLETQLKEDSEEALATMENILERLRKDALTDED